MPLPSRKQSLTLKTFLLLQSSTDTVQEMLSNMEKTSIPHTQSVALCKGDTKVILVIKDTLLMTFYEQM